MASSEILAAALRHLSSGAWQEAEAAATAAMAADSKDPHAALLLGLAVAAMGEDARAAGLLVHAATMRPDDDHPCLDLARLQPPLPKALVARQFRSCLQLAPADDRLRLDFAAFLLDAGDAAQAEAVLVSCARNPPHCGAQATENREQVPRRWPDKEDPSVGTLAAGPDTTAGHHLMGLIQAELGNFPAAITGFRRAVAMNPDAAASWSNLGMMLKIEGQFADAIAAHDRAVALDPANHRFRVNRAVGLLKMGEWSQAWRDYEARLALADSPAFDFTKLMPSLHQNDRLAGLTILALHEDGFGDTLQFLRYLPLLAQRGARIVACVPPALERIMRMIPGVAEVVTDLRSPPHHDFVCPMFSLPRVFGTTVDTIPPVPALAPDRALKHRPAANGLRVGLVWAGQARPSLPGFATLDRRRSTALTTFAPLFDIPGTTFVSLQAGPAAQQKRHAGLRLADPMPDVTDFADTAAVIAGLDVVVSVDTSIVHLAGLLGKPVLLLDRYDGCWRWLSGRSDSPWYPNLTIFRQQQPGDWAGPIAQVTASLRAMAVAHDVESSSGCNREQAFVA